MRGGKVIPLKAGIQKEKRPDFRSNECGNDKSRDHVMKMRYTVLFSLLLAFILSFSSSKEGAFDHLLFHLGLYDQKKEREAIESAVRLYTKISSSFYSTGGDLEGLHEIPAAPLLKRRLVKDINMLKGEGLVMVFDRDTQQIRSVYFINKDFAAAETDEVWAVSLQDRETREPVFNVKAVEIRARYQFVREKGGWIAHEVDVYPKDEDVPKADIIRSTL